MGKHFDFAGWATRANMRCSDGRVIMKDAFKDCDGTQVPLVWNHRHNEPENVLGYALLHNVDAGVRTECFFNDTPTGQNAKELVLHGDINQLSIYANQLKEQAGNVLHGIIREVSLVLAGANPGAFIDSVLAHSEDGAATEDREQGIIFTGEEIELYHSDEKEEEEAPKTEPEEKGETVRDIWNSMTEKQQVVAMAILDEILEDKKSDNASEEDDDEEETTMKHNLFDQGTQPQTATLTHADSEAIVKMAKDFGGGSLRAAYDVYASERNTELSHADNGVNNISQLFPEYKMLNPGAPEMLTTDQGWISKVLNGVHKSPISRIRTRMADVRDISNRRARGYKKGTQKEDVGNIDLIGRTSDPTTVYIRSKLDRDDEIDITDFDIAAYIYAMDRMNLNEELARQITIGDGRNGDEDNGKAIDSTKIRPIWLDDELYCIHASVNVDTMRTELTGTNSTANFGENYVYAEAIIQTLLYAREEYKGTGNPSFVCTPHLVNVMLLARDLNGRRIYDNVEELKAALNVSEIVTAEQYEGKVRKKDTKEFMLLGLLVNFADYTLGATKGGEITHFEQFDINFNQHISLLETRCSGALTRPYSAIALEMLTSSRVDD